ncbi:MAG: oligosaccharide repeat unit polymerase [Verrucomicrobiaceae bacterium]|nr:MAG: oligosaccharide repeat unit polymerase [Verrucomicrobiaceae bacterium]
MLAPDMLPRFQTKWSRERLKGAPTRPTNAPGAAPARGYPQHRGATTQERDLPLGQWGESAPQAVPAGTVAALVILLGTALTLTGETPAAVGRYAAIGAAAAVAATFFTDLRRGLQNLIRADVMAIAALFFLTLFEFFFPQPNFDEMISVRSTYIGIHTVLTGLAGLLIGRHLWRPARQPFAETLTWEIPAGWLLVMLWSSFLLGFFHQIIAVEFDFAAWVDYMMAPRFTQPWQRGRLGDWKALLVELQLFIYLIPPLAGIIFARRFRFTKAQLALVAVTFAFTLFYGFSSGTRNVFASYLVTFLIGYTFAMPPGRRKELITLTATSAVAFLVATVVMLEFRSVGFKNWLDGTYVEPEAKERTLFVDYNLYAICRITEAFPKHRDYLGLEVPYNAIVRPIPRALWPGKPEGLSTSIEETLGVEGLTIAASFVGEAYMAGGFLAVLGTGLLLGAMTGWWSFLVSPQNSELGVLIYASGFFAAIISMRSLFVFTTALLPTIAALVIGSYLVQRLRERRNQLPNGSPVSGAGAPRK